MPLSRRNFFAALLAPVLAKLWPKPKLPTSGVAITRWAAHKFPVSGIRLKWDPCPLCGEPTAFKFFYAFPSGWSCQACRERELIVTRIADPIPMEVQNKIDYDLAIGRGWFRQQEEMTREEFRRRYPLSNLDKSV